ncbi:MAG TPA: poly(3-hydroxyalkanoate) depolymerase [Burkholderiaceae bacterium]
MDKALKMSATPRPRRKSSTASAASSSTMALQTEMLRINGYLIRAGRQVGKGKGLPLLLFNGIGGNIEMLDPLAAAMPEREIITFDIPGVGHSQLPRLPYRLPGIAKIGAELLAHYGHQQADVLGVSWGGAAAQEFAHSQGEHCRRLILCATATGLVMVPSHPSVALKMATPRRYMSPEYAEAVSGDIYGGDFRGDPTLVRQISKHVKWQSRLGYYYQLAAVVGWTSVHWLYRLAQPTLVLAGADDPLVPLANAHILNKLIPHSELQVFDCGHLFLLTRKAESVAAINEFLDRP